MNLVSHKFITFYLFFLSFEVQRFFAKIIRDFVLFLIFVYNSFTRYLWLEIRFALISSFILKL